MNLLIENYPTGENLSSSTASLDRAHCPPGCSASRHGVRNASRSVRRSERPPNSSGDTLSPIAAPGLRQSAGTSGERAGLVATSDPVAWKRQRGAELSVERRQPLVRPLEEEIAKQLFIRRYYAMKVTGGGYLLFERVGPALLRSHKRSSRSGRTQDCRPERHQCVRAAAAHPAPAPLLEEAPAHCRRYGRGAAAGLLDDSVEMAISYSRHEPSVAWRRRAAAGMPPQEAGSAADKVAVVAGVEHVGRLGPAQRGARRTSSSSSVRRYPWGSIANARLLSRSRAVSAKDPPLSSQGDAIEHS
jgi:hypothetical protein